MDNVFVRTAADLEKKYNLSKLANSVGNIETQNNQIIHLQNEVNDIKKTLIINLGDTLQESVSLWFYEGVPTTSNKPYTDWVTPSDHIDDFYYDQSTGYVYKYTSNGWERQYDTSLISALALTNAELDTSLDHERQVFLTEPSPPYQSGDWWILEDGTLMICQIGKNSGTYEEQDFVVSTLYTTTIATKHEDTIEVLKGQVLQITEDYVKYTDLSTGGSTTINGSNITTGVIKSANYVSGTSGTKFDLSNGVIDSKNFQLDSSGNINVQGYITTAKGILTNLQFVASGYTNDFGSFHCLGFLAEPDGGGYDIKYSDLTIEANIPANFEVTSAKISLVHTNISWWDENNVEHKGYARTIRVYKIPANTNDTWYMTPVSYDYTPVPDSQTGSMLGQFIDPSDHTNLGKREALTPLTIATSNLTAGDNRFIIRTRPTFPTTAVDAMSKTGLAYAVLNIIGYMKT